MKPKCAGVLIVGLVVAVMETSAPAGVSNQAVRAAAEQAARWLGREAGLDAAMSLTRRIEQLATRHGDEVLLAIRRGGPEALAILEHAGARGGDVAARLLARHGREAVRIVRDPALLELAARHGDAAALVLMRRPSLARPLIESFGAPAARALAPLDSQNARRLAILAGDGSLRTLGRTDEVLAVVERYGDRAMGFLWRHKGALAVGAVLATFLNDPGPFLDGTRRLVTGAAETVVRPIASAPAAVVEELARRIGWTIVAALVIAALAGLTWRRVRRNHRGRPTA